MTGRREATRRVWTLEERDSVVRRCAQTCTYCGREGKITAGPDGKAWHLDHIVPLAAGGPDELWNITLSCGPCNVQKSALSLDEFMEKRSRAAADPDAYERDPVRDFVHDLRGPRWIVIDDHPKYGGGQTIVEVSDDYEEVRYWDTIACVLVEDDRSTNERRRSGWEVDAAFIVRLRDAAIRLLDRVDELERRLEIAGGDE